MTLCIPSHLVLFAFGTFPNRPPAELRKVVEPLWICEYDVWSELIAMVKKGAFALVTAGNSGFQCVLS